MLPNDKVLLISYYKKQYFSIILNYVIRVWLKKKNWKIFFPFDVRHFWLTMYGKNMQKSSIPFGIIWLIAKLFKWEAENRPIVWPIRRWSSCKIYEVWNYWFGCGGQKFWLWMVEWLWSWKSMVVGAISLSLT